MIEQAVNDPHYFRVELRVDSLAAYSQAAAEFSNPKDVFPRMRDLIRESREAIFAATHAAAVLSGHSFSHSLQWPAPGPGAHYVIIHVPDRRQAAQFKLLSGAAATWRPGWEEASD